MRVATRFTALALIFAAPSANAAELITNGDFETGDYTGWTANIRSGSNGSLNIATPGAPSPLSLSTTPANANGGSFYSVTDQGGPGSYALSQIFVVPLNAISVILSFDMFAQNSNDTTIIGAQGLDHNGDANQHARVDLLVGNPSDPFDTGMDVLNNFYIGADTTGSSATSYTSYLFDITSLVAPGGSYTLRFGEADNQFFFQQGVDNVSIDARLAGGVPEPATWLTMILGFGLAGAAMRRRRLSPLAA